MFYKLNKYMEKEIIEKAIQNLHKFDWQVHPFIQNNWDDKFVDFMDDFIIEQKKDSFVQGYNQALADTGQKIKPDVPERSHKAPDKV